MAAAMTKNIMTRAASPSPDSPLGPGSCTIFLALPRRERIVVRSHKVCAGESGGIYVGGGVINRENAPPPPRRERQKITVIWTTPQILNTENHARASNQGFLFPLFAETLQTKKSLTSLGTEDSFFEKGIFFGACKRETRQKQTGHRESSALSALLVLRSLEVVN